MPWQFPPAMPHGEIQQLFDDVFFVPGTVKMKAPPVAFSRNMTVFRQDGELVIVSSMRLDEAGLEALDALGKVAHVIRVAGFHGMDDPFYQDRYGAKVWAVKGHVYATGFDATKTEPDKGYFQPDVQVEADTELPLRGARILCIEGATPEGILHVDREGGMLVTGDALQNWDRVDEYFSFFAGVMMRVMGFIKPHNVGPGWLKAAKPNPDQLAAVLDLDFAHVLPSHGPPVIGDAKAKYRPAIERALKKLRG